jgi:hypothetical protein
VLGGKTRSGDLFIVLLILFPKTLDATGRIDEFLFAGVKRMTPGADLNADVLFGRSRLKLVSAVTSDSSLIVFGMNILLHSSPLPAAKLEGQPESPQGSIVIKTLQI